MNRLTVAADSVKNQIRAVGGVTVAPARTISRAMLLAGGLLAGLILGVLVTLALGRADTRIRAPTSCGERGSGRSRSTRAATRHLSTR